MLNILGTMLLIIGYDVFVLESDMRGAIFVVVGCLLMLAKEHLDD